MSRETEFLESITAWERIAVREKIAARPELWSVPALIPALSELDVCRLLELLESAFGPDVVRDLFLFVLRQDPSVKGEFLEVADIFEEQPFPRYVTALVYLMILDCQREWFVSLSEAVWGNILGGRHVFWPELLVAVFVKLEPALDTFRRGIVLAASEDGHERFIGENILYASTVPRSIRREVVDSEIAKERQTPRLRRLRQIGRKYC